MPRVAPTHFNAVVVAAFRRLIARVGTERSLFADITVYVVICTWGAALETLAGFYVLASLNSL